MFTDALPWFIENPTEIIPYLLDPKNDVTMNDIICFIKGFIALPNPDGWLEPFKTLDMDKVKIPQYAKLGLDSGTVVTKKDDGFVYRGMALTSVDIDHIKKDGLMSSMLMYCKERAANNSTGAARYIPSYWSSSPVEKYDEKREELFNIIDNRTDFLEHRNTIEGHLYTGRGRLPHLFISSVSVDKKHIPDMYAKANIRKERKDEKAYLLKIKLSTDNVAITSGYEDDHVLRPWIAPENIIEFLPIT